MMQCHLVITIDVMALMNVETFRNVGLVYLSQSAKSLDCLSVSECKCRAVRRNAGNGLAQPVDRYEGLSSRP